jgi:hypothetical protein
MTSGRATLRARSPNAVPRKQTRCESLTCFPADLFEKTVSPSFQTALTTRLSA